MNRKEDSSIAIIRHEDHDGIYLEMSTYIFTQVSPARHNDKIHSRSGAWRERSGYLPKVKTRNVFGNTVLR